MTTLYHRNNCNKILSELQNSDTQIIQINNCCHDAPNLCLVGTKTLTATRMPPPPLQITSKAITNNYFKHL